MDTPDAAKLSVNYLLKGCQPVILDVERFSRGNPRSQIVNQQFEVAVNR